MPDKYTPPGSARVIAELQRRIESGQRRGQAELDRDESREPGELISVSKVAAPARIAAMLGVDPGSELASRRLLVRHDGQASEILTWWLSPGLAGRTGLDDPDPVRGGIRSLLARTADIRIDNIIEQVAARRPEPHEARLLGITRSAPVLALYITARDASGRTVLALDVAMPGDMHELEDAYPVT
jgi:DNA-binding GntR family transcriptional regulator